MDEEYKLRLDRLRKAEEFLDSCEQIYCDGPVYSESGYSYNDTFKALRIAAGIDEEEEVSNFRNAVANLKIHMTKLDQESFVQRLIRDYEQK
jgi:hypothetical protein